jgi:hypothetical protein
MYRLYNPNSGEHFYTASVSERNNLYDLGWHYEGVGWFAPQSSNYPVYRLYNPNAGEHHYTLSAEERDYLSSVGWKYEGIGWYSDDAKSVPLYRQYNPNAFACNHNFTTSEDENNRLVGLGWRAEGIGWFGVVDDGSSTPDTSISIGRKHVIDDAYAAWALSNKNYYPSWCRVSAADRAAADSRARAIAVSVYSRSYSTDLEYVQAAAEEIAAICAQEPYQVDAANSYTTPAGPLVTGVYTCAGSTAALGRVLDYMGFRNEHVNRFQNTHQWNTLTMDGQWGYADGQVGLAGYGSYPFL